MKKAPPSASELRSAVATAADPDQNYISQKLFELLGPSGLDILLDGSDPGTADGSSTVGPLHAGTYAFKAHYPGNSDYAANDSGCETLTVNQGTLINAASGVIDVRTGVPFASASKKCARATLPPRPLFGRRATAPSATRRTLPPSRESRSSRGAGPRFWTRTPIC